MSRFNRGSVLFKGYKKMVRGERVMKPMRYTVYLLLLLGLLMLSGCASMQPLSNYARSGDTVAISLGGTDTNALAPVPQKADMVVTITDASGASYPVKLRRLFRLYGDPTSGFEFRNTAGGNGAIDYYLEPHQGIWMAVLDLVYPDSGEPLPVAPGPASLSVASAEILNWYDPTSWGWPWTNGNLSNIPLEILEGQGSPNPLNYLAPMSRGPMASLEPNPQVRVDVVGEPSARIGGGSFTLRVSGRGFMVTTTTPDPNVQLASSQLPQEDGSVLIKVMLSNPNGFNPDNNKSSIARRWGNGGSSLLRSLRFNLVWGLDKDITELNWQDNVQLVDALYVDLNGNPLPELSASLSKVN